MNLSTEIQTGFIVAIYFASATLLGLFGEKYLLAKIQVFTEKTKWKADDIILKALKGMLLLWALLIATYLAIHQLSLPVKWYSGVEKIIFSLCVISVSIIIGRILVSIIRVKTTGTSGVLPSSSIIANITRVVVFIIGALVILQTLGISVAPILTALGVGGLAVALALQETLSNLFAGIQVIASQQIRTGDYIKLDSGEEGYVVDITWRNTIIRTLPNNLVVVPNAKIASVIITNYYLLDKEIAVLINVGVDYSSDLSRIEEVTVNTAKEVMKTVLGGVKEFDPFIRYNAFSDSSIDFTVIMRAKEFTDQYLIKHEFVKALQKAYKAEKIEIPFPIRTVIIKNQFAEKSE